MSNLNFYCLIIFDILERPVLIYVHMLWKTQKYVLISLSISMDSKPKKVSFIVQVLV